MNYTQANNLLTGRCKEKRKLANNTYLVRYTQANTIDEMNSNYGRTYFTPSYIAIELHGNQIVKLFPDHFTFSACSWHTVTTRQRLNQFSPLAGSNRIIYQKNYTWYVTRNDGNGPILFSTLENTKHIYIESGV